MHIKALRMVACYNDIVSTVNIVLLPTLTIDIDIIEGTIEWD